MASTVRSFLLLYSSNPGDPQRPRRNAEHFSSTPPKATRTTRREALKDKERDVIPEPDPVCPVLRKTGTIQK